VAKEKPTEPNPNLPAKLEDSPYEVCKADPERVKDIIALNIGGKQITPFKLDRIRIPDGKSDFWTVPTLDGTEAAKTLEGIIVHKKEMRGWWPETDPSGKPPSCRSDDAVQGLGCREIGEHYPGDRADQLHECRTCKFAQFESDPKGGKGQWCKEMRAVFILREKTFIPTVVFLPPTSLGNFDDYLLRLATYGKPFNKLVVGFELEKDKNDKGDAYNKCSLKKVRELTDEEYAVIKSYTDSIRPNLDAVKLDEDDYKAHGETQRGDAVKEAPEGGGQKKETASSA